MAQAFAIASIFSAKETEEPTFSRTPEADNRLSDFLDALETFGERAPKRITPSSDYYDDDYLYSSARPVKELAFKTDISWGDVFHKEQGGSLRTLFERAKPDDFQVYIRLVSLDELPSINSLDSRHLNLLWLLSDGEAFDSLCARKDPIALSEWKKQYDAFFQPPVDALAERRWAGQHEWVELKPILESLAAQPDWLRTEDGRLLVPAFLSDNGKSSLLSACGGASSSSLVRDLRPAVARAWASNLSNAELYSFARSATPLKVERWLGNVDNRAFAYWADGLHETKSLEEIEAGLRTREHARQTAKDVRRSPFLEMPLGLGNVPVRMFGPTAAFIVLFLYLYLRLYFSELTKTLRASPDLTGSSRSPFPWLAEFAFSGNLPALLFAGIGATWGPVATLWFIASFSAGGGTTTAGSHLWPNLAAWAATLFMIVICIKAKNASGVGTAKPLETHQHVVLGVGCIAFFVAANALSFDESLPSVSGHESAETFESDSPGFESDSQKE